MQQLQLFPAPGPLVQRMGEAFFHTVPAVPGIYIMTGENEQVLYIGQSRNLRARLNSYKNARPDRAPRKVIRLVHQVESIVWEVCASPTAARLRENELLRLHRPKFNSLNAYPAAYQFILLKHDAAGIELGRTIHPGARSLQYGAFKSRVVAGHAALLQLIWSAWWHPRGLEDFPSRLLSPRPPQGYRIGWNPHSHRGLIQWIGSLHQFLTGESESLLGMLGEALAERETLSTFHRSLVERGLDDLAAFYLTGPRRNYQLRKRHQLRGKLIGQNELDDLLVADQR